MSQHLAINPLAVTPEGDPPILGPKEMAEYMRRRWGIRYSTATWRTFRMIGGRPTASRFDNQATLAGLANRARRRMGFRLYARARAVRGFTASERDILRDMAIRADDDTGQCWPTIKSMAADLGYSEKTIRRSRGILVKAGHNQVLTLGKWRGTPAVYKVNPNATARAASAAEAARSVRAAEAEDAKHGREFAGQGTLDLRQDQSSLSVPKEGHFGRERRTSRCPNKTDKKTNLRSGKGSSRAREAFTVVGETSTAELLLNAISQLELDLGDGWTAHDAAAVVNASASAGLRGRAVVEAAASLITEGMIDPSKVAEAITAEGQA